jgi:monoamine oxidase
MDNPGYVSCHAVEGGMSRLAERLSEQIADAEVRLDTRVVRIEQTAPDSWRVSSTKDGKTRIDEFAAVVIALPATQLASIEYAGQPLRAALTDHMQRFDRAGHYLRVTTLFRSPFWRDSLSGSWFMIDAFGGACVYDESARYDTGGYGVLGFLLAGNDALVLANADNATIVRRVIAALPGDLRARAAEQLLEARVHRWCGAISAQPGGNPARDPRSTHRPDADRIPGLLIVGDYLFDSTLNGVFQSADLATTLLADCLPAVAASPTAQWCRVA